MWSALILTWFSLIQVINSFGPTPGIRKILPMVSITVLATCILCTIKMVQLHPFSLSSCSQVDLPPRYSTGTSSIMERSPNTLNIIVLLKCIQFLTELRHDRMLISGMQKHPPLRIDHVLAHERESAQVQDMMTLSYHIAQVSCRPIGNGACIGGKTFPHSELEKHQSSDFTYAVVVFRRRNDIILTQFGVQIVNGRHDDTITCCGFQNTREFQNAIY